MIEAVDLSRPQTPPWPPKFQCGCWGRGCCERDVAKWGEISYSVAQEGGLECLEFSARAPGKEAGCRRAEGGRGDLVLKVITTRCGGGPNECPAAPVVGGEEGRRSLVWRSSTSRDQSTTKQHLKCRGTRCRGGGGRKVDRCCRVAIRVPMRGDDEAPMAFVTPGMSRIWVEKRRISSTSRVGSPGLPKGCRCRPCCAPSVRMF